MDHDSPVRTLLLSSLLVLAACGGKVVVDVNGSGGGGGSGGATSSTGTVIPPSCPPHSGPGCCPGDGTCCDCVSSNVCQDNPFQAPEQSTLVFDDCICQPQVCGAICSAACAGQGIDAGCQDCAAKFAQAECLSAFLACPINQ
ncbi:Hypothetical protein A7982_08072 [Minicystis rosea]|nr:Hypothetical protein A7982_08072 [Minicystis rosea]